MLLFVCDLSHGLDKGKQIVNVVITANSAFLPSLSQVTHKVSQTQYKGVEKEQKKIKLIAFFNCFFVNTTGLLLTYNRDTTHMQP